MPYEHIYRVNFKNGEIYNGGTLEYPGWNKCPNSDIESLELILPYGEHLKLVGYERYNFFIGAIKSISSGKTQVQHIYILGERKGIVTSYRITVLGFDGEKHKLGDITVRKFPLGKEGIGRTSTSGWKSGISS